MGDDSSSWEDSSADEAPKAKPASKAPAKEQSPKKSELKMRNQDNDSWEEEEEAPKPVPKAAKADPGKGSAPVQAEWEDDSESEDESRNKPKAKSTKRHKLLREKLRAREAKSKSAANDFDDSSSEEEVEANANISERNLQNEKAQAMLFGDDKGVKKRQKKPQRRMKEVPKTLKELYPVNAESRLESAKDLKKFSNAISNYILDLSMGGVDQTGIVVKPVISPNQAKNWVCAIIQKSCDSLDFTQLADVRRQIDSQMTKFKNAEMNERKAKRRGYTVRQKAPRNIRVEKSEEPVYVDGSYNDHDFEAFY